MNKTTRFLLQMLTIADSVFYVFFPFHHDFGFFGFFDLLRLLGYKFFLLIVCIQALSIGSQMATAWMTVIVT
jgi:hypothetical protein